jgi:RimJ/RimL family protein N-acetyltransferase
MLVDWLQSIKHRGYVGPRYDGLYGKIRQFFDSKFGHYEIISYAEPEWWQPSLEPDPNISISPISSFSDAKVFLPIMQNAYHRSFENRWISYFSRGQFLVISFYLNELSSFIWLQDGNRGTKSHYINLQPNEYRAMRGGVLPQFRAKGIHTMRHILLIDHLFSIGARRVFTDAYEENIYSIRAHRKAGYRQFGRIHVKPSRRGMDYVKWI